MGRGKTRVADVEAVKSSSNSYELVSVEYMEADSLERRSEEGGGERREVEVTRADRKVANAIGETTASSTTAFLTKSILPDPTVLPQFENGDPRRIRDEFEKNQGGHKRTMGGKQKNPAVLLSPLWNTFSKAVGTPASSTGGWEAMIANGTNAFKNSIGYCLRLCQE